MRRKLAKQYADGKMLLLCIIVLLSFTPTALCNERNILVLHSYDPEYIYTRVFNNTLKEEFYKSSNTVNIFYEYLDAKRFDPANYYGPFEEYIISKYRNRKFDCILCFDDDALQFLLTERKDLENLSDLTVIFGSIANKALVYFAALERNMTGVFEDMNVSMNVDLMLQILPVKHVFVVTDRTTLGIDLYEKARLVFKRLEYLSVEYLIGLPWNEMKKRFEDAPEGSVILLLSYLRDEQNNVYSVEEVSELLRGVALPVVTLLTPLVNLGGALASCAPTPEAQIEAVVRILNSVLAGREVKYIPIVLDLPKNFLVDYPMLKKFGIARSSLPKNHILLNIPETFYIKYKNVLLPAICVVSILSVLVLLLLINFNRRRRAEEALQREVAFLKQLVETIPDAMCYIDDNERVVLWNKAFKNYLSPTCGQIKGCKISDCVSDISLVGNIELNNSNYVVNEEEFQATPITFRDKSGEIRYLNVRKRPVRNGESLMGTFIIMTDVTALVQMQESLRGQKKRLELTLMRSNVAYFECNVKTDELWMNSLGYELLGYDEEEIKSFSQFQELVHTEELEQFSLSLQRVFENINDNYRANYRIRRKNGEYIWIEATALVVERDLEGNPSIFAGVFWDITEERLKEAETAQLIEGLYTSSTIDSLTGILNRNGLRDKLPDMIAKCRELGKSLSLILLDIDDFKKINDTYGHLAGDSVLRELSEAVRETIRKDDLFVRWGGDEFLIVSMITVDEALCIADRLRRNIEGRRFSGFNVTVSAGISRLLTDEPLEEAMKRADRALYNAKAKGKNSVAAEGE